MLDNSSEARPRDVAGQSINRGSGPRDLVTEILSSLRLEGVEYGRCIMREPWAILFPAQRSARFHFVGSGGCWSRTRSKEWIRLSAGDAMLVPRGDLHMLASAPDVTAVSIETLPRYAVADRVYLMGAESDCALHDAAGSNELGAGADVMFCGALRFNLDPLHPLIAMMPEAMHTSGLGSRDPIILMLLEAMEREVALARVGALGILTRLADALAASIIRAWVEDDRCRPPGWIAAVHCPKVGSVIAAIHADPEHAWTLAALAEVMGASRSSFTSSFTRVVGETPAKYVARVKMLQASQWIATEGMRVSVAANRLGYDSEASFSRAFKRVVGHAPSFGRPNLGRASKK